MISILVIGFLFGYIFTFILFLIAKLLNSIFPWGAKILLNFTEKFYAGSIKMLLWIQPWLKCRSNFPSINKYQQFINTHCDSKRILYVANHRSNLDTFLLISWIPGLRGLAKSTLYYNFIFAPFMWITGFIPVEKGSSQSFMEGLHKLRIRLLEKNIPVLIFPENTRCEKGGPHLKKWSQSVFKIAIDSQATIIPVAIKKTDDVLGKGELFINPFVPIEVKMLKPIETKSYTDFMQLSTYVRTVLECELA